MSTKITIVSDEGDEVDMPEGDRITKTLRAAGAKGKYSLTSIKAIARTLGVSPDQLRKFVEGVKAKASKPEGADPLNGVGQDPIAENNARMEARDKFRGSHTK